LRAAAAILLIALALGLVACGSGSSGTTAETSAAVGAADGGTSQQTPKKKSTSGSQGKQESAADRGQDAAAPSEPAHFSPPSHQDSGGGSAPFRSKGGDNSIQEYGAEVSGGEFAEAAAVVHAFLDARAAGAWAAACGRLAPAVRQEVVSQLGAAQGQKANCPEVLAGLSASVPASALREVAVADVGSLRAEGDAGFLLFRGAQGVDYFIPMRREAGKWKVGAIAPSPLQN